MRIIHPMLLNPETLQGPPRLAVHSRSNRAARGGHHRTRSREHSGRVTARDGWNGASVRAVVESSPRVASRHTLQVSFASSRSAMLGICPL
jgi:hypothetical protein